MRQEVYRTAYEHASSELSEVTERIEKIRVHKEKIERVVDALKPFCDEQAEAFAADRPATSTPNEFAMREREADPVPFVETAEPAPAEIPRGQCVAVPTPDSVQARINNALWGRGLNPAEFLRAS